MSADNVINTAIFNQLAGGTALISALGGTALYYLQAPDNTAKPFIVWNKQAGGDENDTANRTKNLVYLFRVFAAHPDQAGTIDALMDARLHNQTLSVSGWSNFWMARETEVSLIENMPNIEKSYVVGAMYRLRLDKIP